MVPRLLVLTVLAAGCGSPSGESAPPLQDWRPDAAREASSEASVVVVGQALDASSDGDVSLGPGSVDVTAAPPGAPWTLYACYYGPPGGLPALMTCAAGLSYVTCLINDQYIGFCDGSADCKEDPLASGVWVCPAGFAAVNPACASMPAPKYPGSYVYVCSDAGPTGN